MEPKKYPEGHFTGRWMGLGIALATAIVVPVCIITDQLAFIGVGPAFGVSVGLAVGTAIEEKYKRKGLLIPSSEKAKKNTRIALMAGILVLIGLVILTFLLI